MKSAAICHGEEVAAIQVIPTIILAEMVTFVP